MFCCQKRERERERTIIQPRAPLPIEKPISTSLIFYRAQMSLDSSKVLEYLVRTGIWSTKGSPFLFKHIVVDTESVVKYIYETCIANHLKRRKITPNQHYDLYSTTLVNYVEFSCYVKSFLNFFLDNRIEPILVYEGKLMEAPIFGFQASKISSNRHQFENLISSINDYNNGGKEESIEELIKRLKCPNLALNMFKTVVNMRRRLGLPIRAYQAFYNSSPLMAKLARDFRCPILSNDCDLILMDVRAGFILLNEFWLKYIDSEQSFSKNKSQILNKSSKMSIIGSQTSSKLPHNNIKCNFNNHLMFIHQHSGLNQISATNIFPLATTDFIVEYSKSLTRLRIYQDQYNSKDFVYPYCMTPKQAYRIHHNSANRLEKIIFFLTTKDTDVVGNMIRGEAQRTGSSIYNDYKHLSNYHLVACDFKKRLKIVLKFVNDLAILNYIEQCLTSRECTSEYLIDLICCSVGKLASFSYNKRMQVECLKSKHSAHYLLDEGKRMLMSLFSGNKSQMGLVSNSLSNKQKEIFSKQYPRASLTIIDRECSKISERIIPTTHNNTKLNLMKERLQLTSIAKNRVTKQEKVAFLNLVFKTKNLIQLPKEIDDIVTTHLGKDEHHIKTELSIVLSLFKYCLIVAMEGDKTFKSLHWFMVKHMENAIVRHYLFINYNSTGGRKGQQHTLTALIDLIVKNNFESIASTKLIEKTKKEPLTKNALSSLSSTSTKSPISHKNQSSISSTNNSISLKSSLQDSSKSIRHLIELLNTSLEQYYELNAFFEYPLPKLNLHIHYNPILIYNLCLHSFEHTN